MTLAALPSSVDAKFLTELFDLGEGDGSREAALRLGGFENIARDELAADLARRGFSVVDAADANADYVLHYRITDFGRSPRTWVGGYVAWEIVSTLAIVALAYGEPRTRPIAGAYLLGETIEEVVEGYAGVWAIDRLWSPIRIEANLTDLHNGEAVWADASTGMAEFHLTRLFRRARGTEQAAQLQSALRRSCDGLVENLARTVR